MSYLCRIVKTKMPFIARLSMNHAHLHKLQIFPLFQVNSLPKFTRYKIIMAYEDARLLPKQGPMRINICNLTPTSREVRPYALIYQILQYPS